jgi:hypothetical protein
MAGSNTLFQLNNLADTAALSELHQAIANTAQAFLLSAGLMVAPSAGDPVDTAGEYRHIQSVLQENRSELQTRAVGVDTAPLSTADMMMWTSTFGMADPQGYGMHLDDFVDGFSFEFTAEMAPAFATLIANFADGTIPASDATPERAEPPQPTNADNTNYYMTSVILPKFNPDVRNTWDMIQSGVAGEDAIQRTVREYSQGYRGETGEPLTERQLNAYTNNLTEGINSVGTFHASLESVETHLEITPEDKAATYIEQYLAPSRGEDNPLSAEETQAITEQVTAYENIVIQPEDAIRYMSERWVQADDLEHPTSVYIQRLEDRIEHYQDSAGGALDPQSATTRAMQDIQAEIDHERGVPPAVIVDIDHSYYSYHVQLMDSLLRQDIHEEAGGDISDEYMMSRQHVAEAALQTAYRTAARDIASGVEPPSREVAAPVDAEPEIDETPAEDGTPEISATEPFNDAVVSVSPTAFVPENDSARSAMGALDQNAYEAMINFQENFPEEMNIEMMNYASEISAHYVAARAAFNDGDYQGALERYTVMADTILERPELGDTQGAIDTKEMVAGTHEAFEDTQIVDTPTVTTAPLEVERSYDIDAIGPR